MPDENKLEIRNSPQETANVDRDILDVVNEDKRRGRRRRPKDTAEERKKAKLAADGLRAIKAKDSRRFTELLRQAGIREGSPEWKNAWKAFYSA